VTTTTETTRASTDADLQVALPQSSIALEQDEEWCHVCYESTRRRIRLHDYDSLFAIPGLYEKLVYDLLKCDSPRVVVEVLAEQLGRTSTAGSGLRVLDLGAGNGMVGQELAGIGVEMIVGLDISQAAEDATERDRPGIYERYHVLDLTRLTGVEQERLGRHRFNCLTCVAALGFGDIPIEAFAAAYNLIADGGWIAINIKHDFLQNGDTSGFARLLRSEIAQGGLELRKQRPYRHRLGMDGRPIRYDAMVGIKRRDIDLRAYAAG
jgi:hypothetical protein